MRTKNKFIRLVYGAIMLAIFGLPPMAAAESFLLNAELSGFEEVPPIVTEARGRFEATLNTDTQTLDYRLTYNNLSSSTIAAHIHLGQPKVNGGIIVFLCGGEDTPACPASGTVSGSVAADDIIGPEDQGITPGDFQSALRSVLLKVTYVNVHTANFPTGEIRGQIKSDLDFTQPPLEDSPPQPE